MTKLDSAPQLTKEELKLAREWVLDCQWRDIESEDDLNELSDAQIERGIKKHFSGGITEFKNVYCNES
jgi:hypothetical protein